jgi:hypothetical protein
MHGKRLKPITQDVEDDWQNIKAILTAAKESLGYKSIKKKN